MEGERGEGVNKECEAGAGTEAVMGGEPEGEERSNLAVDAADVAEAMNPLLLAVSKVEAASTSLDDGDVDDASGTRALARDGRLAGQTARDSHMEAVQCHPLRRAQQQEEGEGGVSLMEVDSSGQGMHQHQHPLQIQQQGHQQEQQYVIPPSGASVRPFQGLTLPVLPAAHAAGSDFLRGSQGPARGGWTATAAVPAQPHAPQYPRQHQHGHVPCVSTSTGSVAPLQPQQLGASRGGGGEVRGGLCSEAWRPEGRGSEQQLQREEGHRGAGSVPAMHGDGVRLVAPLLPVARPLFCDEKEEGGLGDEDEDEENESEERKNEGDGRLRGGRGVVANGIQLLRCTAAAAGASAAAAAGAAAAAVNDTGNSRRHDPHQGRQQGDPGSTMRSATLPHSQSLLLRQPLSYSFPPPAPPSLASSSPLIRSLSAAVPGRHLLSPMQVGDAQLAAKPPTSRF